MARLLSFLLFFSIMLTVVGAAHYYIWVRLVRDTQMPAQWHRALTLLLLGLYLALPLTFLTFRSLSPEAAKPLFFVSFGWLGLILFIVSLLVLGDVARLLSALGHKALDAAPADLDRRLVLARLFAGAVTLTTLGLGAVALRSGLQRVAVKRIEVALERLPHRLSGTSIVQLTDVHIGPTIGRDFVEEIVA